MAIFTARDSQTIGTVTGGEKQTFEVNINVVAGDYIGICRSGGALYTTSAGDGIWTAGGDQTEGVEVTFNLTQNMTASLYGTGTSIDIGSPAIVRPDILGGGLTTIILKDNPANATGIITSIEIYTRDDISSVRVATFFKGEPPPSVIVTTLAPTLVEDGIANLRLELVDKDGAQINPVGWYCDENAAPTTEYEEIRWRAGIGGIDLGLGIYNRYIKTLPTGHSTLYVQAWADDSSNNRYTGSILSFDIPQEAEYIQLPDITFPEFSFPEFEWNWDWSFPDFYWDLPELISPDFPPYPEWQWWMWLPDLPEWEYPEWEWQYPPTWQWWLWLPDLPEWQYPDYPSQSWTGDICLKRTYSTKDVEELRQKCINYENNYIDYCINNNHNIELIKNFLQTIYNNGEMGGENEAFIKIHPSQQLKTLYLDPLKPSDFKDIINRFIDNNTSNSIGLNHNFDLFIEWLNDYNYTSDGYKASRINPREKTMIDTEPTIEYMKKKVDSLQKEVSTSSGEISHNFNLMKEIIQ